MRIRKSRESEVLHGVWGEAGMSDKDRDSDSMQYATLENAQKCIDNAFRLYDDASKTSAPTKAALIELGIEELTKGLLITFKTPEFQKVSLAETSNFHKNFSEQDWKNFIESFQSSKISDFTDRDHKKRLDTIQFLLDSVKKLQSKDSQYVKNTSDGVINNYGKFSPEPVGDPKKLLDTQISLLSYMDIKKLYKIKEQGFYIDFDDGTVIEPKNVKFQFEGINRVFQIVYLTLHNLINSLNGFSLPSSKPDIKRTLGKLYDRLPVKEQKFLEKLSK